MPVPKVSTSSTPFPLTTPSPCRSASLTARTGRCSNWVSRSSSRTPRQSSSPRFGALCATPFFTTPGKPTETRRWAGNVSAMSWINANTASGVVGDRCRLSQGLGHRHTLVVEHEELEATATDVDSERRHASESLCCR